MKRRWVPVAVLLVAIVSVLIVLTMPAGDGGRGFYGGTRNIIGVIYIEGAIASGQSASGLFGSVVGSDQIIEFLRDAAEDPEVKALVLRINSPGGSAASAQEIAREIEKTREAGVRIVTSMADVAASGGYWIASSTDYIMANPGTVTGSIGVIMELLNVEELYNKLGLEPEVIKSVDKKDIGSTTRALTPEERRILQGMVDDIHRQFVTAVSEGRNIPLLRMQEIADGRVFTGSQALELGLVDGLGNFNDALEQAAKMAEIEDDFEVYFYGQATPFERFLRWFGASIQRDNLSGRLLDMLLYQRLVRMPGASGLSWD
ncbi:MAG: signal peptide peptidase SppA [Bacillota bacterium]